MNILFLTIGRFEDIESHSIYTDLLRCFRNRGHSVFIIAPNEKRTGKKTEIVQADKVTILRVKTGNVTKTSNILEKGLAQITLDSIFIKAIKKYFSNITFDLILYSTPPITLCNVVRFVKKRDKSRSYLLLKDIFPQNAIDLGVMKKNGFKGIIYRFFRYKEKCLYAISDRIGCMSLANVHYLLQHNPDISPDKVEICPNSIEIIDKSVNTVTRNMIRDKYGIPKDKTVFIYGGNLGKPQGIPFLIDCLKHSAGIKDVFFLIVGDGTECYLIEDYINKCHPKNVKFIKKLPKDDYDSMVGACDIGMIFLDYKFTIPNFPSRLLSYMQAKIPVLAVTDINTDIGKVIVDGGFGWWCESNDPSNVAKMISCIKSVDDDTYKKLASKEKHYLEIHFDVNLSCDIIEKC